jgi:hypothetical protein
MKLQEIISAPPQSRANPFSPETFEGGETFHNEKVNGYELKYKTDGVNIVFILVDEGVNIAGLYASYFKTGNFKKPAIKITQTWVNQDSQRRGIMLSMYETIHKHNVLISDGFLSPESKKLWEKLNNKYPGKIKMIHEKTARIEESPSFDEKYNMLFLWE